MSSWLRARLSRKYFFPPFAKSTIFYGKSNMIVGNLFCSTLRGYKNYPLLKLFKFQLKPRLFWQWSSCWCLRPTITTYKKPKSPVVVFTFLLGDLGIYCQFYIINTQSLAKQSNSKLFFKNYICRIEVNAAGNYFTPQAYIFLKDKLQRDFFTCNLILWRTSKIISLTETSS